MERRGLGSGWEEVREVLRLLFAADLKTSREAEQTLKSALSASGDWYAAVMDEFIASGSAKLSDLLAGVREPQDKAFLDALGRAMRSEEGRNRALALLSRVVQQAPSWLPKLAQHSVFTDLLRIVKAPKRPLDMVSGLFLLAALLPHSPLLNSDHLRELLVVMHKSAAYVHKHSKEGPSRDPGARLYETHVQVAFQAYFQRLYGLFPCHVINCLREHLESPSNEYRRIFHTVYRPLLSTLRMHPGIVTGNRHSELSKERWAKREPHDLLSVCSQLVLPVPGHASLSSTASLPGHHSLHSGSQSLGPSPLKPQMDSSASAILSRRDSRGRLPSGGAWDMRAHSEADAPRHSRGPAARRNITAAIAESGDATESEPPTPGQGEPATQALGGGSALGLGNEFWSPSMAVGLETPPESKRTTPVSGLGRRESLQRGLSGEAGASLGGGLNSRRSFSASMKASINNLFHRGPSTETGGRDSWGPGTRQRGPSGSGSVPPSPLRPGLGDGADSGLTEYADGPTAFYFPAPHSSHTPSAKSTPEATPTAPPDSAEEAVETPQPIRKAGPSSGGPSLANLDNVVSELNRGKAPSNATEEDQEVLRLLEPGDGAGSQHVTRIPISPQADLFTPTPPLVPQTGASRLGERRPSAEGDRTATRLPSVGEYFKQINRKRFQSECAAVVDDVVFETSQDQEQAPASVRPVDTVETSPERELPVLRKRSASLPHRLTNATIAAIQRGLRADGEDSETTPRHAAGQLGAAQTVFQPLLGPSGRGGVAEARPSHLQNSAEANRHNYDEWLFAMSVAYPYLPLVPSTLNQAPQQPFGQAFGQNPPFEEPRGLLSSLSSGSFPSVPRGVTTFPAVELPSMSGGGSLDEYFNASKQLYDLRSQPDLDWSSARSESSSGQKAPPASHAALEPSQSEVDGSVGPTSSSSSSSARRRPVPEEGTDRSLPATPSDALPPIGPTRRVSGQTCCLGAAEAELLRHRLEFERGQRLTAELRERRLFGRLKTQIQREVQTETDRAELLHLRGERDQQVKYLSDLRKQLQDLRSAKMAMEHSAKRNLEKVSREAEGLKTELLCAQRKAETAEEEVVQTRTAQSRLQHDLFQAQASLTTANAKAAEASRLTKEKAEQERELELLRQLHAETLPIIDGYRREVALREATEAKYQTLVQTAKREAGSLRKELRKEKNRSDSLKQQSLELEQRLGAKSEALMMAEEAEALLQRTQAEHLAALEHRHRALLATSARHESHIADLYRTIAELNYARPAASPNAAASTASVAIPACASAHREITSYGSWADVGRHPTVPPQHHIAQHASPNDSLNSSPLNRH